MKFPHSPRALSLLLIVSLLWLPVRAQRTAQPASPVKAPPRAQTATAEKTPDVTFDTLLSADAYGVYAELSMVGQHIKSQEFAELLAPLGLAGSAPSELLNLHAFLNAHADSLTTARLMFAAMPARTGLPDIIAAVEMPSVEAAQKLAPELQQFIAAHLAPSSHTGAQGGAVLEMHTDTRTAATSTTISTTGDATRTNRREKRRAATPATTRNATTAAVKQPSAPPVQVKRAGNIIALSDAPFTFKVLRGANANYLFNERGFQAARSRFSADTLFVYFNPARMESSTKQRSETLEKEYRRQEELTRAQSQKEGGKTNSSMMGEIEMDTIVNRQRRGE
jgi:hypothetical protein